MALSDLGNVLLALATIAAIASIGSLLVGGRSRDGEFLARLGSYATYAVLAFISLAAIALVTAFLAENFSLQYVAFNHPSLVGPWAWLYRVSGLWAGREGSLLFWEWILAMYAAFVAFKYRNGTDRLGSTGLAIVNFVQVFFLVALFIPQNNPFQPIDPTWLDPATGALLVNVGMNPLLENPWMISHPPTLFIGYAGLAVPFAFALAALITGDTSKRWVQATDRITVFSWLMLGIGIGLGSVWAYVELAFGGYWAWDPVENASLLPWLTGVGLVHSMTVYRRREGFRAWTIFLSALTFVLVLLGTFITRSGVVQSVHAFQEDMLSFWLFIAMMFGSMLAVGIGLYVRRDRLKGTETFDRLVSKEGSYYVNNVIMTMAALLVAYLTITSAFKDWPLAWLTSWWPGAGRIFGAATYDALARPIGIAYILIMTVCPILSWGGGEPGQLWKRAKWPVVGGAALGAVLLGVWWTSILPYYQQTAESMAPVVNHTLAIVGLLTAAFAIVLPIYLFVDGARKRAAARGEGFGSALGWIFLKARTQSGGYLVHLGMGIILVGLIGSTMYVSSYNATIPLAEGGQLVAGPYTYTFAGYEETTEANGDEVFTLTLDVLRDGERVGTLSPQLRAPYSLRDQNQTTQKVAIVEQPLKDIFVSFAGATEGGSAYVMVKYFPMQWWVWFGFVVLIVGSGLASWPKKSRLKAA